MPSSGSFSGGLEFYSINNSELKDFTLSNYEKDFAYIPEVKEKIDNYYRFRKYKWEMVGVGFSTLLVGGFFQKQGVTPYSSIAGLSICFSAAIPWGLEIWNESRIRPSF